MSCLGAFPAFTVPPNRPNHPKSPPNHCLPIPTPIIFHSTNPRHLFFVYSFSLIIDRYSRFHASHASLSTNAHPFISTVHILPPLISIQTPPTNSHPRSPLALPALARSPNTPQESAFSPSISAKSPHHSPPSPSTSQTSRNPPL